MSNRLAISETALRFLGSEGLHALRRQPHALFGFLSDAWYAKGDVQLPTRSAETLFPGIAGQRIELVGALAEQDGNVWPNELVIIAAICRLKEPRIVFEFGTFSGRTTVNLAANSPEDSIVYTLDIPSQEQKLAGESKETGYMLGKDAGGRLYRDSPYAQKVRQIWADSAEFDEAPYRGQVDLIFIDASHSYEYVANDTAKAVRMLKPGGVILWHDYHYAWPGVVQLLHEQAANLGISRIAGTSLAVAQPACSSSE